MSTKSHHDQNRQVALNASAAGMLVIPLKPDKTPYVKWRELTTTIAPQVKTWWNAFPDAIPGIITKDIVAIDSDRHGATDGVAAWDLLVEANGLLPEHPVTQTPNNGEHHFFRMPDGERLGNGRGTLPDGIDVRGDGGYVVAPGAVLPNGREWRSAPGTPSLYEAYKSGNGALPCMPDWLLNEIRKRKPHDAEPASNNGRYAFDDGEVTKRERAFAQAALDGICTKLRAMPRDSGRNEALNAGAYSLGKLAARGWIDEQSAHIALRQACRENGLVGDDPRKVELTFQSGWQAGVSEPHPDLEDRPFQRSTASDAHVNSRDDARPTDAEMPPPDMSILKRNLVEAPRFPVNLLGKGGDWVKAVAENKCAPVDYVALGLLVGTAGAICAKRRVSPWSGWDEPSILWGALVGPPSFNKSPAIDDLRNGITALEREQNVDWEQRLREHETEKIKAETARSMWEKQAKERVEAGKDAPIMPSTAIAPDEPTKRRIYIVDATTEKVARLLSENPGGLICFRDEMSGLLGSFDKYGGSGNDRSFWIEAYGARAHRYDRVSLKGESIDIPFCAVSLIGALQPDRLNSMLLSGDDDGLAARVLYAWPDPVRPKRPRDKNNADNALLLTALRRLSDLKFNEGDGGAILAKTIPLEPEAADAFQPWWERTQWDAKLDVSGRVAGAIGKLDGIVLRLAMVLEYLSWSWGGSNSEEPEQITIGSVNSAIQIIEEWVKPNLARVFNEAALPKVQQDATIVARWLRKQKPQPDVVNSRALRRTAGFPGPKDVKELDQALEVLVETHWLEQPPYDGTPGRPKKDFKVNPVIYSAEA